MSDATVDELKIRVEVEDDGKGIKSLTTLKTTLQSLKDITDKGLGIDKDGTSRLRELADSLKQLDSVKGVKLSAALPKQIVNLGAAIDMLKDVDFSKLTEMSTALGALGSVGNVNVPRFDNTDNVQTPEPTDLPTAPETSESVVVPPVTDVEEVADAVNTVNSELSNNRSLWTDIADKARALPNDVAYAFRDLQFGLKMTFPTISSGLDGISNKARDLGSKISAPFRTIGATVGTAFNTAQVHVSSAFMSIQNKAEEITSGVGNAFNSVKGKVSSAFGYVKNTASQAFNGVKSIASSVAPRIVGVFSTVGKGIGKAFSLGASIAKKELSALKTIAKGTSKFFNSSFGKLLTKPFTNFGNTIKSATGKVSQFMSSIGRIAMYRAIRAAIHAITQAFKDGTNNLYQYSKAMGGTFAKSMDSISTSMQYFKNSIAAAVAPIINSLAPAIDFAIDKIVAFINVLNQLFASLSGAKTWTKAVKTPKEYAASADKATKTNEKLKKSILGIDEINPLQDNNKSGSGGSGASTPDYSSMFTEVETINGDIADFAESLKKAFNEGDWEGLGKLAADKVNETFASIKWNEVGKKIGYYLNGAISTAYSFLHFTDFEAIGSDIAEVINGAMSEINFDTTGRLLVRKITAVFDTVIGAATTLDWGMVGKSIGDTLKGSFNEISEWFEGKDWGDIVNKIWKGLEDGLKQSDPRGIAESLSGAIRNAINALVSMVGGLNLGDVVFSIFDWVSNFIAGFDIGGVLQSLTGLLAEIVVQIPGIIVGLASRIPQMLSGFFRSIGLDTIAGFFDGITEKLRNVNTWLNEHLVQPVVTAVKKWLKIGSPSKVFSGIGGDIIAGLLEGLKNGWNTISSWFSTAFTNIKTTATNAWTSIKTSTTTAWTNIKTTVTNTWSSIKTNTTSALDNIKSKASTTWSTIKSNTSTSWTNIKSSITSTMSGIKTNISSTFTSVTSTVSNAWTTIKNKLTPIGTKLGEAVGGAFKKALNSALTTIENIINKPISAINSLLTTINKVPGINISKLNTFKLPRLEDGGTLNRGQMFIANEAGPELVGNVGRKTTVMNNDDIVDSVSQGVADANTEQNVLLRELINVAKQIADKDTGSNGNSIDDIINGFTRKNRRDGRTIVPVGV